MPEDMDAKRKIRRYVNWKVRKRHGSQETAMTSEKILSGEKSVPGLGLQSCQQEGFFKIQRWQAQTGSGQSASWDKDAKEKEMSRRKSPRDHAVNDRERQAVGLCSQRLFTFFLCLPWPPKTENMLPKKIIFKTSLQNMWYFSSCEVYDLSMSI